MVEKKWPSVYIVLTTSAAGCCHDSGVTPMEGWTPPVQRLTRSLLAVVACAASLWPLAVAAQPVAPLDQTPEHIRGRFVEAGFSADVPTTWSMSRVTTFTVRDGAERVLMVLVYADAAAAQADRPRAVLVPGYGPSVWHGNVAFVQARLPELIRMYWSQDTTMMMPRVDVERPTVWETAVAVDADLLAFLGGQEQVDL
jgi:hypothetical protein